MIFLFRTFAVTKSISNDDDDDDEFKPKSQTPEHMMSLNVL